MKESFDRIVAWAKANPWLAGGIVLVVVLLAYFVFKRSGGGSSGAAYDPFSNLGAAPDLGAGVPSAEESVPGLGDVSIPGTDSVITGGGGGGDLLGDFGGGGGGFFEALNDSYTPTSFDLGDGSYYDSFGGGSESFASYASVGGRDPAQTKGLVGTAPKNYGASAAGTNITRVGSVGSVVAAPKTKQPSPALAVAGIIADTAISAAPGIGGLYSAAKATVQIGQQVKRAAEIRDNAIMRTAQRVGDLLGTRQTKGTSGTVTNKTPSGSTGSRSSQSSGRASVASTGKPATPSLVNPYSYGSSQYWNWQSQYGQGSASQASAPVLTSSYGLYAKARSAV